MLTQLFNCLTPVTSYCGLNWKCFQKTKNNKKSGVCFWASCSLIIQSLYFYLEQNLQRSCWDLEMSDESWTSEPCCPFEGPGAAFGEAPCCCPIYSCTWKDLGEFVVPGGGSRTWRRRTQGIIRGVRGRQSQNWHTWPIYFPGPAEPGQERTPEGTAQGIWSWIHSPALPWGG